ncbi:MAG TPA: DUF4384 domain-containing protein [Bryobacteraceae bacterium]|nr:DUF4384 domain-containing protein [Bryobacteraceae bacterium]
MSHISGVIASLSATGMMAFAALAQEQPKTQFTARELFYYAPPAAIATARPPAPKPPATQPKPAQVDSTSPPSALPVPAPGVPRPALGGELPGGGHIVMATATAPAPTAGTPLGLKYTILKLVNGEMTEVAPDSVFHAGDRIRFNVETNGPGYLYIVSQGSSGTWKPMFPSSDVDDGSNRVEGFHGYTMPPKTRLYFDEQAGEEKVFIVFSREPEQDLEKIVYSLQGGKAKPVSQPAAPRPAATGQVLIASAAIDDSTVGHLRQTYARDLIVEKITEDTPGDRKEKAVYVVNPTGSRDSRVVADLTLVHK